MIFLDKILRVVVRFWLYSTESMSYACVLSFTLSLSPSLSLSLALSLSFTFFLSLKHTFSLSLSLSFTLTLSLSLSHFLSLSLFLSFTFSLCLSLTICLSVCLSVSLSLFLTFSLYIYLSFSLFFLLHHVPSLIYVHHSYMTHFTLKNVGILLFLLFFLTWGRFNCIDALVGNILFSPSSWPWPTP